ncbi:hypothetical protein [Kiloniella sp.]|uniref:hypothetical protein n=1 Tax=Kiloniella sp. TaxID=1938587 RepID=UPI003B0212D1
MKTYNIRGSIFILLSFFILTACEYPRIISDRTTFHQLGTSSSQSVFIVGYPEEVNGTLEFAAYKKLFEQEFLNNGYLVTNDLSASDYTAFVSYGIDGGKTSTHSGSRSIYGQTGGGTTYHSGSLNTGSSYSTYTGTSYTMPTYGVVGSKTYSYNVTTFTRSIAMDMIETSSLQSDKPLKVYEGRIVSSGCLNQLNPIMKPLVRALFQNFPGENGQSSRIETLFDPSAENIEC